MKRIMLITAVASLLTVSAFAQVNPDEAETAEPRQAQQIQNQITDLYIANFKSEVQLTDEQFIRLNPGIRNFMRMQFENARRRQAFKQQLSQLMDQPNPSESDVTKLIDAKNQFEREAVTKETRFLTRINSELSPRQQVRVMEFNRRFMDEKLPGLIQQARDRSAKNPAAVRRNQQQAPAAVVRPNANRPNAGQNRPGTALKGRNK
jgi:hypothetical protein